MDATKYKDLSTSRGIKYHYYFSPPTDQRPYLLFLHGFPSTSYDWRYQVKHFESKGYGIIVPDMLGYGGTDKPTDPQEYRSSKITRDLVDILDQEKVEKVVVIGHDWGCKTTSRLASYYPQRFAGFAFLAVGYLPPREEDVPFEHLMAYLKKLTGNELLGYQVFFSEPDADKVIEKHFDSFMSLLYADEAELWGQHLGPPGAAKKWITEAQLTKKASYITTEDVDKHAEILKIGGMAGPLCWYKAFTSGIDFEDDRAVPKENYEVTQHVFFGGATKDFICLIQFQKIATQEKCKNLTVKEYETSHWVMLQKPEELNRDLEAWVQTIHL